MQIHICTFPLVVKRGGANFRDSQICYCILTLTHVQACLIQGGRTISVYYYSYERLNPGVSLHFNIVINTWILVLTPGFNMGKLCHPGLIWHRVRASSSLGWCFYWRGPTLTEIGDHCLYHTVWSGTGPQQLRYNYRPAWQLLLATHVYRFYHCITGWPGIDPFCFEYLCTHSISGCPHIARRSARRLVLCGMVWYGMAWHGMAWYDMVN